MAKATTGYSWTSGETVTPAKLNSMVDSATVTGIKNADVDAAAAIVASKLDLTAIGLSAWQTKTGNYTAVAGDRINANTTSAAFTITLPATPTDYTEVTLADHAGTWKTNNLTVARNGSNINGVAEDLTCDQSGGKQITLRYKGATIGWRIYT